MSLAERYREEVSKMPPLEADPEDQSIDLVAAVEDAWADLDAEFTRRVRTARTAGKQRADEVCRVPSWPSAQVLAVLRDQEALASERLQAAYVEVAHASGLLEGLQARVAEHEGKST